MADPRERWNDQEEAMRMVVDRHLGTVWTALPVKVVEDSDGHICKLQAAIKGWQRGRDNQISSVDLPQFGEVPVIYAQGGNFLITHPVKSTDEGVAVFSSRNIDGWWTKGSEQTQEEPQRRRHSLSDAMYMPGMRSNPRKLGEKDATGERSEARKGDKKTRPASTNSIQIRTENGDWYIELTETDVNIVCKNATITAQEDVTVTCRNASVTARENITAKCKNASVTAEQNIDVHCTNVNVNASSSATVHASNIHLQAGSIAMTRG